MHKGMQLTKKLQEQVKVGDPWTFVGLSEEQMANAIMLQVGGVTSRWYSTDEPGRLFRITAIHEKARAVETVFIGFQGDENA